MDSDPHSELYKSLKSQLEALRDRVHELETENAKFSSQISNCICQKTAESDNTHVLDSGHSIGGMERLRFNKNDVRNRSKEAVQGGDAINMHHLPKRYVALKVMYFGQRFYGFASEALMDPTIESEIFKALQKTKLIFGDKKELQYYRCGRTDKGVSSVGQVISLFLRSNLEATIGRNEYSAETFAKNSYDGEIDYVKILNRVLPKDIRIMGWSCAPTDFSARFSCLSREYKYFFWGANLNIMVVEVLLDVKRMPRKPQYVMAPEIPLVLQSCEFNDLKFICSSDARQALHTHLEKECQSYKLQAAIFHEALLSCSNISEDYSQPNSKTKKKDSAHIPLMSRPTEPSYEERRAKLDSRGGMKR